MCAQDVATIWENRRSNDAKLHSYVCGNFGSEGKLELAVLTYLFKHGFYGSGDDRGSLFINGHLASASIRRIFC